MLRIAIVGAGPSGLSVAGILSHSPHADRFKIDVFEKDSRARDQGAGWDVDRQGRAVLSRAGVDLSSISRAGSATSRVFKQNDLDVPLMAGQLPSFIDRFIAPSLETNRHALRESLLQHLNPKHAQVHFNQAASSLKFSNNSNLNLSSSSFNSSSSNDVSLFGASDDLLGHYDLVIDSGGVNSHLRKYRVVEDRGIADHYTGISMIHGVILDPEASLHPKLVRALGQGTAVVLGSCAEGRGSMGFYLQRFGARLEDRRTSWGWLIFREKPGDLSEELGLPLSSRFISEERDPEALRRVKKWIRGKMGPGWDDAVVGSVEALDSVAIRPLFCFPSDPVLREDEVPLICIGDALHALPPYTGSGGNLALHDAGDLADHLLEGVGKEGKKRVDVASLRDLERKMLKRTEEINKAGQTTKQVLAALYGRNDIERCSLFDLFAPEGKWTWQRRMFAGISWTLNQINRLDNYGMQPIIEKK